MASTTTSRQPSAPGAAAPSSASPPVAPRRRRRAGRVRDQRAPLPWLGVTVWTVIVVVPLYFLVTTAFRTHADYLLDGPFALPRGLSAENFALVWTSGFPHLLLTTAVVTVGTVGLVLVLALPAAYAIVRSRSRWVRRAFDVVLLGLAIPAQATIVPIYLMITKLHLYDSLVAIVLPTAAFSIPLSVLVLTSTMRDVPNELYEAMAVDGATPWRAFVQLALPLSRGGITTVGIYTAMGAWNGFLFPLILTQSADVRVLTLGLWTFQSEHGVDVPAICAAVLLSLLPLLALYLVGRRQLLSGLTAGFGK